MSAVATGTAWERGRLDARRGPKELLFGRMHEDCSVEAAAFRPGGRVFCIASAGCTAMALSRSYDVVAADINPAQVEYARRRFAGAEATRGAAERRMAVGRALSPLLGWRPRDIRAFVDLGEPAAQVEFWRRRLDTRRLRAAMRLLLSRAVLRLGYAKPLLAVLPPSFGDVLRGRMERCFARHPNRGNPYVRSLLLGELPEAPPPPEARRIRLVNADAADLLEREPAGSFDGFSLSNILDGASDAYRRRLLAAVRRAAAPGAVAVIRSFGEPTGLSPTNVAAEDRAMLWGIVDVKPADAL